ncbi:MAG: efflux RND transporter periplasmic adaptor subunit [Planctomycetota bacterium]
MLKWISRLLRATVGLVALAAALAFYSLLFATRPTAERVEPTTVPPTVRVMPAAERPVERVWSGYGTARAVRASEIGVEVAGRVIERPDSVLAGRPVERGELLYRLDDSDYTQRAASLTQQAVAIRAEINGLEVERERLGDRVALAENEVEVARRDLDRAQQSFERGAANVSEVDRREQTLRSAERTLTSLLQQLELIPSRVASAEARLASLDADLAIAERNIERSSITAPFAGVLQSVELEIGEWARVGDVAARVVDLSKIEIPVRLPASAASGVSRGDAALLRPDGPDDRAWTGRVARIAPETDERTRTVGAFVEVRQDPAADPGSLLRPGRFLAAQVRSDLVSTRLIVPRRLVTDERVLVAEPIRDGDPAAARFDLEAVASAMRVAEREIAVERYIEVVFPDLDPIENQWAVCSDEGVSATRALREGDLLLLSNLDQLRVGDIIAPADSAPTTASLPSDGGEG